jgi:riboflavin biosynthesis pyrimidine reductase
MYDGGFHLVDVPPALPAISLVFVQSRDGNTAIANPADLGGGPTDLHLIYEGLSRVAADGVMAGAATAAGASVFFSVWHPELVSLRRDLSLPRHPAQIVVSATGRVDLDDSLLFNVPDVPVFVLAGAVCRDRCAGGFARRPWITVVPLEPDGLGGALARLRRDHRIDRISAIGGRSLASSLIDAGLVQDLCLTTTARAGGEPNTPFYVGCEALRLEPLVRKAGTDPGYPIVVEHARVRVVNRARFGGEWAAMALAHLTLPTQHVNEFASFLEQTLGYPRDPVPSNVMDDAAWLNVGRGQQLHVIYVEGFAVSPFEREFGRHVAVYHPRSAFDDLKHRLVQHGAALIEPLRPTPFDRFFFREPVNGYVFEVIDLARAGTIETA